MLEQILPLTRRQKQLVILSFARILPVSSCFSQRFYEHLWEIAPETKELFSNTNIEQQRENLFKAISTAITGLDNTENLIPGIRRLSEGHRVYAVSREYYQLLAQSLLWTVREELGQEFTPDLEESWFSAYQALLNIVTGLSDYASEPC